MAPGWNGICRDTITDDTWHSAAVFDPACSASGLASLEPEGLVYTKRWVMDLFLDQAGYTSGHS